MAFAIPSFAMPTEPMMGETPRGSAESMNFVAHLSGKLWTSRVAPNVTYGPIVTLGEGQAIFHVDKDGDAITFMLIVANIQNVTMAHIHLDDGSPVGPIVVWLYPRTPPLKEIPGRFDGILMSGTITASNLVGELEGKSLSTLLEKIENGNAYVVVHTTQHPPGEIRGWIH